MRIGVLGLGVVGQQLIALLANDSVSTPVVVSGRVSRDRETLANLMLGQVPVLDVSDGWDRVDVDVIVLCSPDDRHVDEARAALAGGCHVVSLGDSGKTVTELLSLHDFAREVDRTVVVGASASPGAATMLAVHAAALFESVDEIDIAITGTAGPACIDRRAKANRTDSEEWRDGEWVECGPRSGPEIVFFPDPVGIIECARGDLSEAILLRRLAPEVDNISVKVAKEPLNQVPRSVRRGRKKQIEVEPGAQRVTVSGLVDGITSTVVYGLVASTRDITADLAQLSAWAVLADHRPGAFAVAEVLEPRETLRTLADRGSKVLVYEDAD